MDSFTNKQPVSLHAVLFNIYTHLTTTQHDNDNTQIPTDTHPEDILILQLFSATIQTLIPTTHNEKFTWEPILKLYVTVNTIISRLAHTLQHHKHLLDIIPLIQATTKHLQHSSWTRDHIIYARFSIVNPYVYIGSTSNYTERAESHIRETHYHHVDYTHDCKQKCTYDVQGEHGASSWFMVPIAIVKEEHDLRHTENTMIRRHGTLNKYTKRAYYSEKYPMRRTKYTNNFTTRPTHPTTLEAITMWHCDATGTHSTNLANIFNDIDNSILPATVTCEQGLVHDSNFIAMARKHATWTVSVNGMTLRFDKAVKHIKLSNQFQITDIPAKISHKKHVDKLMHLARFRGAYKHFAKTATDDDIEQCYKKLRLIRDSGDKERATIAMRAVIKRRFKGFTFKPYTFRVPHFHCVATKKLTDLLHNMIRAQLHKLPIWLIDIHIKKATVIRTKHRDIANILCNHTRHAKTAEKAVCTCQDMPEDMPRINGHVCFLGDEYNAPNAHILTQNAGNIPTPSLASITQDICKSLSLLATSRNRPMPWTDHLTKALSQDCAREAAMPRKQACTVQEVLLLKRALNGLVISPLDKNSGKLITCCPVLYKECLDATFDTSTN